MWLDPPAQFRQIDEAIEGVRGYARHQPDVGSGTPSFVRHRLAAEIDPDKTPHGQRIHADPGSRLLAV
jgi:hypothetical protein